MCRFQKAINLVGDKIKMSLCDLSEHQLSNIKKLTIDKLNADYITSDVTKKDYGQIFTDYYKLFVLYPTFSTPIKLSVEDLEETDEYKEHRKRIISDITKSQEHRSKIEKLQI